jgi:DNA-binding transcriptional MocR family regulator
VPTIPKGGFGIWLPLPYDDLEFTQNALRKNVQVAVGKAWFPAEKSGEYARLSFAASDETALLEAVKRLSEIR